jgi:Ca-activated chloride channel homolog
VNFTQKAVLAGFMIATVAGAAVRIDNPYGRIDIHVEMGAGAVSWKASSPGRKALPHDVEYIINGGQTQIICHPGDGAEIDLEVSVPHTIQLTATSTAGAISLTGLIDLASLRTQTGAVTVSTYWELARLRVLSDAVPASVVKPKLPAMDFVTGKIDHLWALTNSRPDTLARFGNPLREGWRATWERCFSTIQIVASNPEKVALVEFPLPEDSWIKVPSQAGPMLSNLWQILKPSRKQAAVAPAGSESQHSKKDADSQFRSDVGLVSLAVPIYGKDGHPVAGLTAEDFELSEDKVPQKIKFANTGQVPFHLILLLDLSKSAYVSLPLVKKAARDFVQIARPQDEVAVDVLSNSLFQIVSPMTGDRSRLLSLLDRIPPVAGGSPIYDSIVLSALQTPIRRSGEQVALVVLTDGMDNQFEAPERGSVVSFDRLRKAAAEWPVPIYTLLFPYESVELQKRGRQNMQRLSDASGGRLFEVASLGDLEPIYARVAEELRSVYTIAYYPVNQNFNGAWRTVDLRCKRPDVTLRTRSGYIAH